MRRIFSASAWPLAFLAAACLLRSPASAQEVVAILSSDSAAYREALSGFEEGYGRPVPTFSLAKGDVRLPPSTKIIVAFGGKAALHPYPQETTLVYCLTPAFWLGPDKHAGPRVRIYVAPRPEVLLPKLKEIQPTLKRLAVFGITRSPGITAYFDDFKRAAQTQGIEARIEYLDRSEDLPERLRSLTGKIDAMWMSPDPLLITPATFEVVKEFGRSNDIPFYAPMESLVDKGAVASIAASFRENGRAAGKVAAQAVSGQLRSSLNVFPEKYEMTINLSGAAQSGLTISPEVLKKADRVTQ
jgi:hypothetical protein